MVNRLLNRDTDKKLKRHIILESNDGETVQSVDVAGYSAGYFCSMGTVVVEQAYGTLTVMECTKQETFATLVVLSPVERDLHNAINSIKNNNSCGLDGFSIKVIKQVYPVPIHY